MTTGPFSKLLLTLGILIDFSGTCVAIETDFESTAAAVFSKRCIECHNPTDRSGELDLTRPESAMRGGASGKAFEAGASARSLLIAKISAAEMPPEKNGKSQKLADSEMELLRQWIDAGAAWPKDRVLDPYDRSTEVRAGRDWWSFQGIQHPNVPLRSNGFQDDRWDANPIDAFVMDKLVANQLTPAPRAEKSKLIRRLYVDLIGMPPTSDEIDAYVADESPDAYERRVDALLASPQFGERWARHWLDVVRYADTNGYERDAEKKNSWRYRDWVMDAFNRDMPYDQFLTHQLAGDEISNRSEASVIATGFLRLGTWDDEPNDPAEYQYDRLEDLVHATTTAFLGLTVKCARCHDHKFDPIYQTDYYRIGAAFWPGPVAHRDRAFNGGPTREELGFDVLGWTDITNNPKPLHALKKGDIHRPLQAVDAGPLSCCSEFHQAAFTSVKNLTAVEPNVPELAVQESKTTGRRRKLALWMTDAKHPLTARVIVNRIWQHHFGEGLVRTPDNFGFNGQRPTHPELLDWLACELIANQWNMKALHRRIVTSATYQQSSVHPKAEQYSATDASNTLLWRANRRRLDAESLRDAILFATGRIDFAMGGPSFKAPISSEALEGLSMKGQAYKASATDQTMRRSLYMFNKRSLMVPFMTTFDICDNTVPTGRRESTVVPTQALAMLNSDWVHEQSRAMATQVVARSADPLNRTAAIWKDALGRPPSEREQRAAKAHVWSQLARLQGANVSAEYAEILAWASLCHVLINTNEFIYVD
ncbi:MAG: PSD1 and planctomycete cytochrome C domain-containing protein [Pirellula sp.]